MKINEMLKVIKYADEKGIIPKGTILNGNDIEVISETTGYQFWNLGNSINNLIKNIKEAWK